MPIKGIELTFCMSRLRAGDLINDYACLATVITMAAREFKDRDQT